MVAIKAIETAYKGYRFRSRLEARWAVFFDALGVEWEYEKEGFDLGGLWYLPDFWLPKQECWIEIKAETPTEAENDKASRLAIASGRTVFVFFGPIPTPLDDENLGSEAHAFYPPAMAELGGEEVGWDNGQQWCVCEKCGLVGIQYEGRSARLDCDHHPGSDRDHTPGHPRLRAAYDAARSARFEHGESGAPPRRHSRGRTSPFALDRDPPDPPWQAGRVEAMSTWLNASQFVHRRMEPRWGKGVTRPETEAEARELLSDLERYAAEERSSEKQAAMADMPLWRGNATQFLSQLGARGIRVSSLGGGTLDIQAPPGALTDEIRALLREHRQDVETALTRLGGAFPYIDPGQKP